MSQQRGNQNRKRDFSTWLHCKDSKSKKRGNFMPQRTKRTQVEEKGNEGEQEKELK